MQRADDARDSVAALGRPQNQRVEGTKPSLTLEKYAGTFADPDSLRVVVVITWPPEPGEVEIGTGTTAPSSTATSPGG